MGKLGNGGGGEKEIGAGGGLGIWESKVDAVVESRKYCRLLGMEGGKWEKFRVGNMGVGKVGSRGSGENGRRGEGLVGRGVGGKWGTVEWWAGGGEVVVRWWGGGGEVVGRWWGGIGEVVGLWGDSEG